MKVRVALIAGEKIKLTMKDVDQETGELIVKVKPEI